MTLEELKQQAAAIVALQPPAGYEHVTFSTRSSGAPTNAVGVPEVHREEEFAHDTVCFGRTFSGSVTVTCRDTGTVDAKGRTIYETPGGRVFVYAYQRGSPTSLSDGRLIEPRMQL